MSIASNIKRLRTQAQLSQAELGKIAGVTDKAVSTWEAGLKTPRMGAVEKMAAYFDVPKSAILDDEYDSAASIPPGFQPLPRTHKVPIVGHIACGQPITAEENIEDYADVPEGKRVDFCLLCEGDSMIDAGIDDGDVVYIRKQPDIENGEIAAVRIDNEATLKRVYKYPDRLVLQPENRSYPPMTYVGEEMNQVSIEGKAVGWTHWV
mgnify:CR=1 FL=1